MPILLEFAGSRAGWEGFSRLLGSLIDLVNGFRFFDIGEGMKSIDFPIGIEALKL